MSAGRARRIAPVGGAEGSSARVGADACTCSWPKPSAKNSCGSGPVGGHLDDVGQVAVLDPRCACRGVDVSEQLRRLARRERVVAQTDPGVPAA